MDPQFALFFGEMFDNIIENLGNDEKPEPIPAQNVVVEPVESKNELKDLLNVRYGISYGYSRKEDPIPAQNVVVEPIEPKLLGNTPGNVIFDELEDDYYTSFNENLEGLGSD